MSVLMINEQIAFLRKQKGITQEELAQKLGVTNQSVSKWESGTCCPDIQLLPDIAMLFGVSVDELLGYKPADTFANVYLQVKSLFQNSSRDDAFSLAFRLSALLHEGACTRGYKEFVPWDTNKNHALTESYYKWGLSACSEPEGATMHRGNIIFFTDNKISKSITPSDIRMIFNFLEPICNKNTLTVLFALYELTLHDSEVFASLEEIKEKSKLSEKVVLESLDHLVLQMQDADDGSVLYRLDGGYMIMPSLLQLFMFQ